MAHIITHYNTCGINQDTAPWTSVNKHRMAQTARMAHLVIMYNTLIIICTLSPAIIGGAQCLLSSNMPVEEPFAVMHACCSYIKGYGTSQLCGSIGMHVSTRTLLYESHSH